MTPPKPAPIDTAALLAVVGQDAELVRRARTRLGLASLGLIAARIRADHPTARYLELGFTLNLRTYAGQAEVGRIWLEEAEQTGRWRACLDDDARTALEACCSHIGQDVEELLPTVWVKDPTTGLQVVDLDAVVAALPSLGEVR
jgi:hypothetical protein